MRAAIEDDEVLGGVEHHVHRPHRGQPGGGGLGNDDRTLIVGWRQANQSRAPRVDRGGLPHADHAAPIEIVDHGGRGRLVQRALVNRSGERQRRGGCIGDLARARDPPQRREPQRLAAAVVLFDPLIDDEIVVRAVHRDRGRPDENGSARAGARTRRRKRDHLAVGDRGQRGRAIILEGRAQEGAAVVDRDARPGRRLDVDIQVGVQPRLQPAQSVDRYDLGDQLAFLVWIPRRFELERHPGCHPGQKFGPGTPGIKELGQLIDHLLQRRIFDLARANRHAIGDTGQDLLEDAQHLPEEWLGTALVRPQDLRQVAEVAALSGHGLRYRTWGRMVCSPLQMSS